MFNTQNSHGDTKTIDYVGETNEDGGIEMGRRNSKRRKTKSAPAQL
jgi:hypothetical protein